MVEWAFYDNNRITADLMTPFGNPWKIIRTSDSINIE